MKIGFISDIHLDLLSNLDEFLDDFYKEIRVSGIETLVIAGDISEDVSQTIEYINNMSKNLNIPVYYVPGNHDMWYKNNKLMTDAIYNKFVEDPNCISGKVINLGEDIALVGDVFWYDYSFANQGKFTKEELIHKTNNGRIWNDYFYVNWLMSDISKSNEFIDQLEERLKTIKDKRIIFISHMINHKAFTVPEEVNEIWGYFNGFLGSRSIYNLIMKYNVEIAACGHVHHRQKFEEENTTFICSCLGYEKEWKMFDKNNLEPSYQIKNALTVMDV